MDHHKNRLQEQVGCAILLIAGLGFILFLVFTTPRSVEESELITVSGIAVDAELRSQGQYRNTKQVLTFSLGGYRFSYGSREKGFKDLLEAIRTENELMISVHPDPKPAIFANVPDEIYMLNADGKSILTYSDAISDQRVGLTVLYGMGGTMFICGVAGGVRSYMRRGEVVRDTNDKTENTIHP